MTDKGPAKARVDRHQAKNSSDFAITNTWEIDPIGPLSYEERQVFNNLKRKEIQRLKKIADRRFKDDTNNSLMMSDDQM
jgi:hypothetical protein